MKLVHPDFSMQFLLDKEYLNEWIIESPECYLRYLQELLLQADGKEGKFILSHQEDILDISKKMEIIIDPFHVDINDRRILNKVYESMCKTAYMEENYVSTQKVIQIIFDYVLLLEGQSNYITSISDELDLTGLLKAAGVRLQDDSDDLLERLVTYVEVVTELLKKEVIVLVNIRSYLNDDQMSELIKTLVYKEIRTIFIENQQRDCLDNIRQYIIDKDRCEIY